MWRFKRLIIEIHRRSLWQVLLIYVGASWAVLEAADVIMERMALPDWVYGLAMILLLVGLPVVLATAFVQEGMTTGKSDAEAPSTGAERAARARPMTRGGESLRGLFTWRKALAGGVLAFALWGVIAAGWLLFLGGADRERGSAVPEVNPNVVAVFPFRVSSADEGLGYLREGMVDLLAAKLTGEGGPRAADPRSTLSAWRRRVESEDQDLPRDAALGLAQGLGAGQLLLGDIVGSPSRLVMNAALVGVSGGETQTRASAEGPLDSLTALVDQLTAQLLAREAGVSESRLAVLTSTSLSALRAYLEGQAADRRGRFVEAVQHFERALEIDSSFALAALGLVSAADWTGRGAPFGRALAVAWAHRDRLSIRDQAYLTAWAGPRYPEPSPWVELLASSERAIDAAPDRPEPWYAAGDILFHEGHALGHDDAWDRAADHFERALELDSTFASPLSHLVELAVLTGDTSAARELGAAYLELDSLGDLAGFVRWRVAHGLGGSASLVALRKRFPEMPTLSLLRILGTAQIDGIASADAELAAAAIHARGGTQMQRWNRMWELHRFAMNRGRPREGLEIAEALGVPQFPRSHLVLHVLDAIYWDGDSAAAARAVLELAEFADAPLAPDTLERQLQYAVICAVEQWRLWHGEVSTAERAISRLRNATGGGESDTSVAPTALCTTILEALLAGIEERPDAPDALDRLNSLMRIGPPASQLTDGGDLVAARLHEEQRDLAAALEAVRRRSYNWAWGATYLSTHLREEGRLAALTGDREGAIRAYRHYLALRPDPDPALQSQVDWVRAALQSLLEEK